MRLILCVSNGRSILSEVQPMRSMHIQKDLPSAAIPAVIAIMLFSTSSGAQTGYQPKVLPPAPATASVHITDGPSIESVKDGLAIIRWTSNNPGGADEHFGVVHYGTDPTHLDQTAKSHIRLNQNHPETVFRVRVDGLKPQTTYYYNVGSMQGNGTMDPLQSAVYHFRSP
jgi:hypothetical protein